MKVEVEVVVLPFAIREAGISYNEAVGSPSNAAI
jgi:hypothetical protein